MRSCRAQINPHFLFNTLQSVANMAGIEQATVTGDMVVRLANFFRYTLDHDDSVVTLDRELALLRDYISLQELRFGERISFEMNCDSRCAACELPKFTLQPIVENSIVHGHAQPQCRAAASALSLRAHRMAAASRLRTTAAASRAAK